MIPMISGLGVLKWLRESPSHRGVPVIMLTSRGEPQVVRKALQIGADDFLLKPVNASELIKRVHLHTFQPTVSEVKKVLVNLHIKDDFISTQMVIKKFPANEYSFYPVRSIDLPLCVRVPYHMAPAKIATLSDLDINKHVVIYGKGVRWLQLWPDEGVAAENRSKGDDLNESDIDFIIEKYA